MSTNTMEQNASDTNLSNGVKKKILIATGIYPPDIGGPATYSVFLERLLPQHGVEVEVCAFTKVRWYPKGIRHAVYLFSLVLRGRHANALYALDTVSVGIPAWVASALLRKTLYLRVPGDYAWEQGQQRYGITETLDEYLGSTRVYPWQVRVLRWLEERVARHAVKIIVPSEYMKRVVRAWGISEKKVVRIYSALSPITCTEARDTLREAYGYEGYVVTTAARLVPWKGINRLIEVVVALRHEGVAVSLDIIGEGPERPALEKSIGAHGADAYIRLIGQVEKRELWERVRASDVFVLNTAYEGLSHQLIEVMDIGTPIITTPVGGNAELITHGESGLLVPFNDGEKLREALRRILRDEEVRTRCVRNARVKAKLFREDVIIPEIVQLFL